MSDAERFWAFISYSHVDRPWAAWLHRAIESYALPRQVVGKTTPVATVPARLRPIFKDREDLAADADLRERVHVALVQSRALIVVCSPAAVASTWVEEEIERFKRIHGEARVFAVIVAGAPNADRLAGQADQECFPAGLRFRLDAEGVLGAEPAEPIAADVRPGGDGRRLAKLKLIAGILGLDLDDLVRRDAQRRGRRLVALTAAALVGLVAMSALAVTAVISRNEARAERGQAEGLVAFMLGDLRNKLEPTGRLDLLDAVAQRTMAYYSAQAPYGLDDAALGQRARVLHLLGDLDDRRGNLAAASRNFQEAASITRELLARDPRDTTRIFNHAQSVYWVGYLADRRGQEASAEQAFLRYKRLAEKLVALAPARDDYRMEVGYADANLGALALHHGDADQAAAAYTQVLAVDQALLAKAPMDRDRMSDLADTYGWLADAESARGRLEAALADRLRQRGLYDLMLARQGGDNAARAARVITEMKIGVLDGEMGRAADARARLTAAAAAADDLVRQQPDNTVARETAAFAFLYLARERLKDGLIAPAAAAAARADRLAEDLTHKDPTVRLWRGFVLGGARLVAIEVAASGERSMASVRVDLAPAANEWARLAAMATSTPGDVDTAPTAAEAGVLAGDYASLSGHDAAAEVIWRQAAEFARAAGFDGPRRAGDRGQTVYRQALARLNPKSPRPTSRAIQRPFRIGYYAW